MSGAGTDAAARCGALRRDGSACRAPAGVSGYCFGHDPGLREARARGRKAGGQGRGAGSRLRRAVPPNLRAVLDRLIEAMQACHEGELEPRVASAMASLAGAIVRVYEVGELALRVQALEEGEAGLEEGAARGTGAADAPGDGNAR